MAAAKKHVHKPLERFRAKAKRCAKCADAVKPAKPSQAAEAKKIALQAAVAATKAHSKQMAELTKLSVDALQEKLANVRAELLTLRFKHATGQLSNVRELPAARREIARILTLLKQKTVGA